VSSLMAGASGVVVMLSPWGLSRLEAAALYAYVTVAYDTVGSARGTARVADELL
jgi:hypothetical protein